FRVGNTEGAVGPPSAVLRVSIVNELAAKLERVVALDPRQVDIGRRFLLPKEGNEGRADSAEIGTSIPAADEILQARGDVGRRRYAVEESADRGETVGLEIPTHTERGLVEAWIVGRLIRLEVANAHMQQQGGPNGLIVIDACGHAPVGRRIGGVVRSRDTV